MLTSTQIPAAKDGKKDNPYRLVPGADRSCSENCWTRAFGPPPPAKKVDTKQKLLDAPKQNRYLPGDMWGLTVVAIAKSVPPIMGGRGRYVHVLQLLFSLCCLALSIYLQVQLLLWVDHYEVEFDIARVQNDYRKYHKSVFDASGMLAPDIWYHYAIEANYKWAKQLCHSGVSNMAILGVQLFLWTLRSLGELRKIRRIWRYVGQVPPLPADATFKDVVVPKPETGGEEIIALNCITRYSLYLLVVLPKIALTCYLLWVGLSWLTSSTSMSDLLLDVLSLQFVVAIDTLILWAFFPQGTVDSVQFTSIAPPKPVDDEEEKKQRVTDYHCSVCFCTLVMLVVVGYMFGAQQVLPGYTWDISLTACDEINVRESELVCRPFEKDCFPKGTGFAITR